MDRFINSKVSSVMYHPCALRQIRPRLSLQLANDIGCAIVLSRLDYCNFLLVGSSEQVFNKLLRVQKNVARIVMNSTKRTHGQDLLDSLHWLPIRDRGIFKIATMIYTLEHTPACARVWNTLNSTIIVNCGSVFAFNRLFIVIYSL